MDRHIMAKKKTTTNIFCETYVLPSERSDLEEFIEKYRLDMSEQIVSSIDHAIKHRLPIVEVFQFKNSEFVVTLSRNHFQEHLDHIFNYYMSSENYELCSRVIRVRNELNQINTNEAKKAEKTKRGTSSTVNRTKEG